jgi:tetratricopeptide (TPR) repeat protein
MGSPLNGRPSVPSTRKNVSWKTLEAEAATARTKGQTVYELRALLALDDLDRLGTAQRERLVTLLERRAAEFRALGRAIPESRDLDRLERLAPAIAAGLLGEHALAERTAGDVWLSVGAIDEARAAYERAGRLGAADLDFRVRALWGHPPPATTTLAELRAAVTALPLRAAPPFALAYVTRGGRDRATLERAIAAGRQERMAGLTVRAEAALRALDEAARAAAEADAGAPDAAAPDAAGGGAPVPDGGADAPADGLAPPPIPADLPGWLLGGLTVEGRLFPLLRAHPEILDDAPAAVGWVDLMLDEDETSPEVLELAAVVFGRAHRFGGTERMLMEMTFATPDRAAALARGAVIWERLGRTRDACASWIRAARWRDDPEDPTWRTAIACARRDPGAGNWRDIRDYVLARARPDRRAALAAALDAPEPR